MPSVVDGMSHTTATAQNKRKSSTSTSSDQESYQQMVANHVRINLTQQQRAHHLQVKQQNMLQVATTLRASPIQGYNKYIQGYNIRLLQLHLPPGTDKLGLAFHNNKVSRMPELGISPQSPILSQVPIELRFGWCIVSTRQSSSIGCVVQPQNAEECVTFINQIRKTANDSNDDKSDVTLEMLLIQVNGKAPMMPPGPSSLPKQQPPTKKRKEKESSSWEKMYKACMNYKDLHGNFNVEPSQCRQWDELAEWIKEQRELYQQNKLTEPQITALNKIDFVWATGATGRRKSSLSAAKKRESAVNEQKKKPPPKPKSKPKPPPLWDDMYESLVRFKAKTGGFLPNSGHLSDWIQAQKDTIEHMTLPSDQVQKLHELGIKLSVSKLQEAGIDLKDLNADDRDGGSSNDTAAANSDQKKSRHAEIHPKAGSTMYWQSTDAAKLFNFEAGSDIIKGLNERMDLLRKANESVDGWKSIVPNDGKEELYNEREILILRHKSQYIILSYMKAISFMNQKKWTQCCDEAAEELSALGHTQLKGDNIQRMQTIFRKENAFPHPGRLVKEKKDDFWIFDYFPVAKEMFLSIAENNSDLLTATLMKEKFVMIILPELERQSREKGNFDDDSKEQKLLVKLIANPPSLNHYCKWMRNLNIEWDPR